MLHTYTHLSSRRHRWSDVIRVLMEDYSDITGTAAKLNLLASPCACCTLRWELRVHVWYWGACWKQSVNSPTVHPFICPLVSLCNNPRTAVAQLDNPDCDKHVYIHVLTWVEMFTHSVRSKHTQTLEGNTTWHSVWRVFIFYTWCKNSLLQTSVWE